MLSRILLFFSHFPPLTWLPLLKSTFHNSINSQIPIDTIKSRPTLCFTWKYVTLHTLGCNVTSWLQITFVTSFFFFFSALCDFYGSTLQFISDNSSEYSPAWILFPKNTQAEMCGWLQTENWFLHPSERVVINFCYVFLTIISVEKLVLIYKWFPRVLSVALA